MINITITITITITNTITIAICYDLMLKLNLLVANTCCLSNLPLNRYYTHTDLYIYIYVIYVPILDIYILSNELESVWAIAFYVYLVRALFASK